MEVALNHGDRYRWNRSARPPSAAAFAWLPGSSLPRSRANGIARGGASLVGSLRREQNIHFDGVVETLRLQNPHIALTLTVTKGDGTRGTVNFVEGAPAGRLARVGLSSSDLAVGKPIKAIGAPRRDDPNLCYLKTIILP